MRCLALSLAAGLAFVVAIATLPAPSAYAQSWRGDAGGRLHGAGHRHGAGRPTDHRSLRADPIERLRAFTARRNIEAGIELRQSRRDADLQSELRRARHPRDRRALRRLRERVEQREALDELQLRQELRSLSRLLASSSLGPHTRRAFERRADELALRRQSDVSEQLERIDDDARHREAREELRHSPLP